jgi:Protein of unknown function (DUF3014)
MAMTKSTIAWVVGSIALTAALIWGAWQWQTRTTPTVAPPPVAETPEAAPPAPVAPKIEYPIERAEAEPGPAPQATLDASDTAMREALANLFKGKLPAFVQPMNLIRNIVATIDNLPRSKAAPRLWPVQPTPGRLSTINAGDSLVIAPDNSARYAPVVALVHAIDTKQLAAIYVRFYPLFQQAYRELGYPDGYFNDRLVAVIDHLIATPDVKPPIALVQPNVLYQYADPELEALSAGQKAMTRVGPDNAAVLKAKLREIRFRVAGPIVAR